MILLDLAAPCSVINAMYLQGNVPLVEWSRGFPLTAYGLRPLPGFESLPGHLIKLSFIPPPLLT